MKWLWWFRHEACVAGSLAFSDRLERCGNFWCRGARDERDGRYRRERDQAGACKEDAVAEMLGHETGGNPAGHADESIHRLEQREVDAALARVGPVHELRIEGHEAKRHDARGTGDGDGELGTVEPGVHRVRGVERRVLGHRDPDVQVGQRVLERLERPDGHTELGALAVVGDGAGQRLAGDADQVRGDQHGRPVGQLLLQLDGGAGQRLGGPAVQRREPGGAVVAADEQGSIIDHRPGVNGERGTAVGVGGQAAGELLAVVTGPPHCRVTVAASGDEHHLAGVTVLGGKLDQVDTVYISRGTGEYPFP